MLLGNYTVFNKLLGKHLSGPSISDTRANFSKSGSNRNMFVAFNSGSSVPYNYLPPYSWIICFKKNNLLKNGVSNIIGSASSVINATGKFNLYSSISGISFFTSTGITISSGVNTVVNISATITTYTVLSPENLKHYV